MHAFVFYSVHEELFVPLLRHVGKMLGSPARLRGFVWSADQERRVRELAPDHGPLIVFTRDILSKALAAPKPDLDFLAARETEYGIPLNRMIFSERHLLAKYSWTQVLAIAEHAIRAAESALETPRPDMLFSEDVSCLNSYIYYAAARHKKLPYWFLTSARLPGRVMVYRDGLQEWNRTNAEFARLRQGDLAADDRERAARFLDEFREKPRRPTGMDKRSKFRLGERDDLRRLRLTAQHMLADARNPIAIGPVQAVRRRLTRVARWSAATKLNLFEKPDPSERYVLFPIHFQPEASTLVQAPYYVDQLALVEDIARSVPSGVRVYVKEHLSNQGRRPLAFYYALRRIFGVRLLGPDVDTWPLIRNAEAIVTITGTMGWEGILFGRPVITFGDVFYNAFPLVHRAFRVPKDAWPALFVDAIRTPCSDRELLLRFIAAIQRTSHPGRMHTPRTFPDVLAPANLNMLGQAVAAAMREMPVPSSQLELNRG
jgi:hypothetical protein